MICGKYTIGYIASVFWSELPVLLLSWGLLLAILFLTGTICLRGSWGLITEDSCMSRRWLFLVFALSFSIAGCLNFYVDYIMA